MAILDLVGNVAFPIIACLGMAWYVKYITDNNYKETQRLNEQHTKEMLEFKDEMKEALNNNTQAINQLCNMLREGGK